MDIDGWIQTLVIAMSILASSLIAWRLYEVGWRRRRLESLVREVVSPLVDEVRDNRRRMLDCERGDVSVGDGSTGFGLVAKAKWERSRVDVLWLHPLLDSCRKDVEESYKVMSEFDSKWLNAHDRFLNVLWDTFYERIVKEEAVEMGMDEEVVRGDIRKGIHSIYAEGFKVYLKRSWKVVESNFKEDATKWLNEFHRKHGDYMKVPVGVLEVLSMVGERMDSDSVLMEFKESRKQALIRSAEVLRSLRSVQYRVLNRLDRRFRKKKLKPSWLDIG